MQHSELFHSVLEIQLQNSDNLKKKKNHPMAYPKLLRTIQVLPQLRYI